jgi:flagellar hook-associated protein 1 FlgK
VQVVASGAVVDGMRIDVTVPPGGPTDRFLLKPVSAAAGGMQALLQDPRDLAAASPLLATTDVANTGTAAIGALTMLAPPTVPGAHARITFTDNVGNYTWDLLDSSNTVLSSGSGSWQAGGPIPAPPADIDGFDLRLTGVPRAGDAIDVVPTPPAMIGTNNGNALALSALRDMPLVGRTTAGGVSSGGATASDAYAAAMAQIGVRVQSAKSASTISGAVADQAQAQVASTSGVNLDEEAANLITYQQSYQAAAKVLQVAQSIFDTLLQTARS